jgi:hypothetical protein
MGHGCEPDDVQYLVDAPTGNVVRLGENEKVVAGAPKRMEGLGVKQCAHLTQGPTEFV